MNQLNLIELIEDYFLSIGIDEDVISTFLSENHFDRGLIINLSPVCLMPKNKPENSNSNQTHIHVTGDSRYFFFEKLLADSKTSSSEDVKLITDISDANLNALLGNLDLVNSRNLEIKESFTMAKIAHRHDQENQVQISKIRLDDSKFIELRSSLFSNDLLVFLGYKNSNRLFTIGIPKDYYAINSQIINTQYLNLDDIPSNPIKPVLEKNESNQAEKESILKSELIEDAIYQNQLIDALPSSTSYAPLPKLDKTTSSIERNKRSAAIGKEAVKIYNYLCNVDSNHITFISRTGFPYIEAHHLIPISNQDDFEYSLDVKANIVPLCPNCHAKIHYGTKNEIRELLEKLYNERIEQLKLSGIIIDLDTLLNYYS